MKPSGPRDKIIGTDAGPEAPFPLRMHGKVVSGFGRGSKEVSQFWELNRKTVNMRTDMVVF